MGLRALNNTESPFEDVFSGTGGIANSEGAPATGMDASGGTTQTYTTPTGCDDTTLQYTGLRDCSGTCNGSAREDECGHCVGGSTSCPCPDGNTTNGVCSNFSTDSYYYGCNKYNRYYQ